MSLRIFSAILALTLVAGMALEPAHAQSAKKLSRSIDQLEKQVKALQRRVFNGDQTYFAGEGSQNQTQRQTGTAQTTAALIVRLDALEETMRSLTGQLEEMRYQQRQETERLESFMAQTNYRLNALDGAGPQQVESSVTGAGEGARAPLLSAGNEQSDFASTFKNPDDTSTQVAASAAGQAETLPDLPDAPPKAQQAALQAAAPIDPKARFDEAFQLARKDRFDDAEQAFLTFITDHPEHELASNAQYWLGRVYTAKRQTSQAAEAFFEGYRRYPDGNKAPENLLAFASTLRMMEKSKEACTALKLLQSKVAEKKYPNISERVLQGIDSENSILACL